MPNGQELTESFNLYNVGWGMFAGNGKIYDRAKRDWIRTCKPLKHKDCITINIEWMKRGQFKKLYVDDKDKEKSNQQNDDEFVVALTFHKNDEEGKIPKGAAQCLPASVPYKLAVSSAKKRWEIEWISSNWSDQKMKQNNIDNIDDDVK